MTAIAPERAPLRTPVPTPVAAYVAGVPESAIRHAIERAEIQPLRREVGHRHEYLFELQELVYLRLCVHMRGVLAPNARRQVYELLRRWAGARLSEPLLLTEILALHIESVVKEVEQALEKVHAAGEWVVSNAEIRGGESVVRGTRVPAHLLADLYAKGVSTEEILADYPSVTAEGLEAAITWARLHPKRGRPRRGARWREQKAHAPGESK